MRRKLLALLFVPLAFAPLLRANVYGYHPASSLHLGAGYDPSHPTEPYTIPCLISGGERNIDSTGGTAEAKYSLLVISSREQLYKAMHMSASIDASYGFFSASGSSDIQNNYSSSEDSLTWIAQAEITFGRFQPIGPMPIEKIAAMSADDIRTVCGTELVTQETRGVIATITYTFKNLSTDQKHALSTAISASAKFTSGGGSANTAYKEALEEASRHSELSIEVEVRGGPGKEALEKIITADSDLAQIRKALATYISNATASNARSFQYETSSTSQFYPKVGIPQLSSGRDAALASMYSSYKDLSEVIDRIQSLTKTPVRPEDQYLNIFVSEAERANLQSRAKTYSVAMDAIRAQAKSCLSNDAMCHPYDASGLPRVSWPNIPEMPEMVVARRCPWYMLFVVGHKAAEGEKIGTVDYQVFLLGDSRLFDRVMVVEDENRTPVSVRPVVDPAVDPKMAALFATVSPSIGPDDCKNNIPVDTSKAFGQFHASFDLKYKTPLRITLELRDKFGRINYLHLTNPT
jgi:hypothetical protein